MSESVVRRFGGRGPFNLPYSRVVTAGDFVFVSGQVGVDENGVVVPGGIEAETQRTLERIGEALGLAGCSFAHVVKVTAYLGDAREFARFNKAYGSFFPTEAPARTTIVAPLVIDAKVEMDAIAYRGGQEGVIVDG